MNVLAPSHWRPVKSKRLFAEADRRGFADEELLAATQANGVVPRSSLDYRVWNPTKDLENYKLVEPGQFVISLRSFQGGIEYSEHRGIVSPAYTVMALTGDGDPRFFRHLLKSTAVVGQLDALGSGIRQGKNISFASFGGIVLIMPPLREQMMIADFLDRETARIDELVDKKIRLTSLLEEKRTSLITEAVTKGLDPSVEMKPGSRWLGDVPAHWDLLPLKRLVSKIGSGKTPRGGASVYVAEGVTFLRSQNVHFGGLRLQDVVFISREVDNEMRSTRVRPGDVLLNITGASLGRCCVAAKAATPANVNQHVCILRPLTSTDSLWLSIALESRPLQSQIWASQGGAAREGLNGYMTGSLVVPVPPTEEQQRIGVELGRALESLDRATNALERQTALIVEHRRALITAAVTGQIDIAAQPSEPEEAIA